MEPEFGLCVILTVAGESKHRALADGICAPAVQLKPLQQGSVGPEKNLHCIFSRCTGIFSQHTLNCLLALKVSLFSYFLCLYHSFGKRFLEWQHLPFLATFLLTDWDNNPGNKDKSSQFHGHTRGWQGRNGFMHRLRHTAAWDWQQPPRAAYSNASLYGFCTWEAEFCTLGAAWCLRAVPLHESPEKQHLPSLRETSLQLLSSTVGTWWEGLRVPAQKGGLFCSPITWIPLVQSLHKASPCPRHIASLQKVISKLFDKTFQLLTSFSCQWESTNDYETNKISTGHSSFCLPLCSGGSHWMEVSHPFLLFVCGTTSLMDRL